MIVWLLGIVVLLLLWAGVWRSQPKLAFGILLGLPIAWILSLLIAPYVTGMTAIPIWIPPIPFLTVALLLFVFGSIVWLRADNLPPPRKIDDEHKRHDESDAHH